MRKNIKSVFGTGGSRVVKKCQVCDYFGLQSILFLGYLPPVNTMYPIGTKPREEPSYPAELLFCPKCKLVQLGLVVDPKILFPSNYPYTSSTTKILRDNFSQLYEECTKLVKPEPDDLIIDIGSNDGNLLTNFKDNYKVLGITPEDIGKEAIKSGIPTLISYFTSGVVRKVLKKFDKAKLVTATNVFAHIENVNEVTSNILNLMSKDSVFISESHYLLSLIKKLQYDTIYHEHLRYYSLHSLRFLLEKHGLEVFHAKKIPTHGGSIRVYAAKKGIYKILPTVKKLLKEEKIIVTKIKSLLTFKKNVVLNKLKLLSLLSELVKKDKKIYGISAPSRASTLINYVGLDEGIIDCVLEVEGSHKIGKYIPGTLIPILGEEKLYKDQPDYVLLFSWHIAKELIPKLKSKGFKGKFVIPLPSPKIVN